MIWGCSDFSTPPYDLKGRIGQLSSNLRDQPTTYQLIVDVGMKFMVA